MSFQWRRLGSRVAILALAVGFGFLAFELISGLYHANVVEGDHVRQALQRFTNVVQLLVVAIFVAILGAVVHRYTEPYFILWFFGWLMWLVLYAFRQFGWWELPFNGLNSFFFLLAGLVLNDFERLSAWIGEYPPGPKKRFGAPLIWVVQYFRLNPGALIVVIPIGLILLLNPSTSSGKYVEGSFAVISIGVFGIGLFRRIWPLSRDTAWAALLLHGLYLEPQLAKMSPWVTTVDSYEYLFAVGLPAVVLKPALALFVAQLALRETKAVGDTSVRRETALRESAHPEEARITVVAGRIEDATERARRILGDVVDRPLKEIFHLEFDFFRRFNGALRESDALRVEHDATLLDRNGNVFTAHLVVERTRPRGNFFDRMGIAMTDGRKDASDCFNTLQSAEASEEEKVEAYRTMFALTEGWWGSRPLMTFVEAYALAETRRRVGRGHEDRLPWEEIATKVVFDLFVEAPHIADPRQWVVEQLATRIRQHPIW